MKTFKDKSCKCGTVFTPTAPAELLCQSCKEEAKERHRKANASRQYLKRRARGAKFGQGAERGNKHPNFKHGRYTYETIRREIKESRGSCERCDQDLREATHYKWVVHHRDHNPYNYSIENLELLCKRCHQIEHECWKAFEGATTIS